METWEDWEKVIGGTVLAVTISVAVGVDVIRSIFFHDDQNSKK
jgi:hypothetical protein